MLKITMLQTPGIALDGAPLSLPFKRADALLYYMLVRRSATRQELIALLWESCDEATGLKNLRNTLYTLKKSLGGDVLISPQKSLVTLNPDWEIDCDYDRFTRGGDLSAYQGPLLQGFAVKHAFAFDEWMCRTRERLHEQYLARVAERARGAQEAGESDEAIHWSKVYLQEDPYDEAMAAFLMEELCRRDRYAQAVQVYVQLKENLASELGVDPLESTTLLYYEILNRWNDTAQAPDVRPAPPVPVGREEVYAALNAAAASFSEGAARRCNQLLVGELGSGKSELIGHFLQNADLGRLTVVCCECLQSEEMAPLSAWDRILLPLREHIRRNGTALPAATAQRLGQSFSFLGLSEDSGAPLRCCDRALEDAVLTLFSIAGRRERVLLVVENLQWADSESLKLLNAVLRRVEGGLLMAVLTSRILAPEGTRGLLAELEADGLLHRYALRPLSCDQTRELLRREIGDAAAAQLAGRFYRETGGNLKLLTALTGAYRHNPDVHAALEAADELLANRLRGLSPAAEEAARRVCLFPEGVSSRLLLEMMGRSVLLLNPALEELRGREIIEECRTDGDSCYRFVHDRVREMVYGRMSAYQRIRLHRQAAELLVELELPENEGALREIARNYALAGERLSALEYRIRALELDSARSCEPFSLSCAEMQGGAASAEALGEEVQQCLQEVAALRREAAAPARLVRLEQMLSLLRGRLALFHGETQRGYEILGALSGSPEAHPADLMASACYLLASSALYQQSARLAERYVSTGMRLLERGGTPVQQARFYRLRGNCFSLRGDYERARYYLQEAADLLEELPPSRSVWLQLAAVYSDFGRVHRYLNEYAHACACFKRALGLAKNVEVPGLVWTYVHYGRTTFVLGDHSRGRELFRAAHALAERTGELWGRAAAAAYCAYYAALDGEGEASARYLADAQDCAGRLDSPLEAGIVCFVSMHLRRHLDLEQRDDPALGALLTDDADAYARRGVRLLGGIPDVFEADEMNRNLRDGITSQLRYRSSELYSKNKRFMSE